MTQTAHQAPPVHALLTDGGTVVIREGRPGDHPQVLRLYEDMTPEDLRLRFFTASLQLGRRAADRIRTAERPGYLALLAQDGDQLVGIAEYETGQDPATAEIALVVAGSCQGRGVGTLLMEHLVHAARGKGVTSFAASTLAENRGVLRVFSDLGQHIRYERQGVELLVTIDLSVARPPRCRPAPPGSPFSPAGSASRCSTGSAGSASAPPPHRPH